MKLFFSFHYNYYILSSIHTKCMQSAHPYVGECGISFYSFIFYYWVLHPPNLVYGLLARSLPPVLASLLLATLE